MATTTALLFAWSDVYSVKIGILDAQHKKLIGILNDLNQAMVDGHGKDKLGSILSELVTYTKSHFATEEKLMQSHKYPDYHVHKGEHERLAGTVLEFQRKFLANEIGLTIELLAFLKDWLTQHILGSDKRYGPFLNSKGVY